ncbi:MAG: N-acetyl-gamma-glutamyl-phosphate reductase, partial [Actinobacteria bacterium]|nr:N-acetyl-gamma-glutamyl-phosphate reductase [Actinomycetota bacterium]
MAVRTAVIGASGYTGAELLRLCAAHPDFEVAYVTGDTKAGEKVGSLYPSLAATYADLVYERYEPSAVDGYDVAFLGLPHGASQAIVPDLRKRVGKVVDLAADFRLKDASLYPTWYGEEHTAPELLAEFAFGIPELFPDEVAGADLVAAAGCYVTAAALPLAPLVRAGLIETTGIVVDAASGVSGAGRALKDSSHFGTVDEN